MQSAMFLLIVRPTPFLSRRLSKKIEWARRKPGSVSDNHLSWLPVTRKLMRPTYRAATGRRFFCPIWSCSEWGLHEKYVTISPCELLPHNFNLTTALPVSAECFCCTFPIVAYAGCYPAPLPCGARTFLMDRLSPLSPRPSDLLICYNKGMKPESQLRFSAEKGIELHYKMGYNK